MRITIITSMSGTRLISRGSSCLPRLKSIVLGVHGSTHPSAYALAVHHVDQLRRLLLHLHHQRVDLVLEMAVEDQRGNGDRDAERGVVERDRDAVRQLLRIGAARRL